MKESAHLLRVAFYVLLLLSAFAISFLLGQQNATDSAIDPTKSSFAVGLATSRSAEAQPSPHAAATAVVVWDQYNNAGTAVTLSATFTDSPAMNSDLADDFVVQDYAWIVRWIDVDGAYFNGPGPANSFTVTFYYDNGGFPGNQVYTTFASWEQNGSTFRIHVCDNYPCQGQSVLNPGRYWVEIQANMTEKCCGEWGWTDRTVTNVNAAVWRNPSGFFGSCQSWGRRGVTCGFDASAPDQVYRIYANVVPTPTPTATPTATHTPTPCGQYWTTSDTLPIVPGTTDIGNHCDNCDTAVTLPFPFRLYGVAYTSVMVSSNGRLDFLCNNEPIAGAFCLPAPARDCPYDYTIFPLWATLDTDIGQVGCSGWANGCGVFTSISGTAPNRIFNVEWHALLNFTSNKIGRAHV